jgi:hypothetical protein
MAVNNLTLNLDEIVAEAPVRDVVWKGEKHPVTGLTGLVFLKIVPLRKALEAARKQNDDAVQFEQNMNIILLMVPTLESHRAELMAQKLVVIDQLANHVMSEFNQGTPSPATTDGTDEPAGE